MRGSFNMRSSYHRRAAVEAEDCKVERLVGRSAGSHVECEAVSVKRNLSQRPEMI